jgi:mannose-1-phosphate guanylyltransferase
MSGRATAPTVDTALVLAGGRGTRLLPLTARTPKPMLPFCGASLLAGMVLRLVPHGIRHVVLVVGRDAAPFATVAGEVGAAGVSVEVVTESEPLDTAGGARLALRGRDRPVLVLNGDVLTDLDVGALLARHAAEQADATLALTRVEDTSAYGVCLLDGVRITGFVEKPPAGTLPGHDTVNAGTYVLGPGVLDAFPDGPLSFERTVFPALVASGRRVVGHVADGVWSDLGTPARLLAGQRTVLGGGMPWPALAAVPDGGAGVRIAPGAAVAADAVLDGPVLVGPGARVAAGARVGPDVTLGAGVEVGPGARVRDAMVGPGTRIGAGATVVRALLGADVVVAAGAVTPELAVVGDGDTVGPR